ncbi:hypothetical protein C5167_037014 [Papaver somniferum]|uniref:Uncharacterized protein n=1 Tax=Papaver somniferum TaxID=3469 RepID=A0A4Y7I9I5_PAPSO|nr:hypothetical protein C5167_037014 [Papaver somniferum]
MKEVNSVDLVVKFGGGWRACGSERELVICHSLMDSLSYWDIPEVYFLHRPDQIIPVRILYFFALKRNFGYRCLPSRRLVEDAPDLIGCGDLTSPMGGFVSESLVLFFQLI